MRLRFSAAAFLSPCFACALVLFWPASSSAEIESAAYVRYLPRSSVYAQPGKVEITEAESSLSYECKAGDQLPMNFSLITQYIGIDSTTPVALPTRLTGLSFDMETTLPFFGFKKTYLCLGLSPSFFEDGWDFTPSAFRIPLRSYLIYAPDSWWTFIAGLAVYPEFENEFLPVVGFIYKPSDKLVFDIVPDRPNITYALNKSFAVFTEAGTSLTSEFHVDAKNTVLHYNEDRFGMGVKYTPRTGVEAYLSAGGVFNRYFKYEDSTGKVNIKNGAYLEFRVAARF